MLKAFLAFAGSGPISTPGLLPPKHEKLLLWLLTLTQLSVILDFVIMMPLSPQIMKALDIGPAAFAGAVSAYSWCAGISGLLAATCIDRFDRKRLLLAVYALFALSNLACGLATNYHMLLLSRAFAGITGGVLGALVLAIVGDVVPLARRGAAMGLVMSAFSLAAIAGVPLGVVLGAHMGWNTPFFLLVALSVVIWVCALRVVPTLTAHIPHPPVPLARTVPQLWQLVSTPAHLRAFTLTAVMMVSQMLVAPFLSPIMVANLGIAPEQIAWIYLVAGCATFFTARAVGRLADRYGKRRVFAAVALGSSLPILFVTHLPALTLAGLLVALPIFMVCMGGRNIPMQALQTAVPPPARRGAFMSVNSAVQQIFMGTGTWLGGLLLSTDAQGHIAGYGLNGWISVCCLLLGVAWVRNVRTAGEVPRAS